MKSRVFYELEKLRNRGFPNFGDESYSEPIDNIGERIEEEFKKRPLQEEEQEVAMDYFSENYIRSLRASERYIQALGKAKPYTKGFEALLEQSRHFFKRALNSELRARKVCGDSIAVMFDTSEDEVRNDLIELNDELHIIAEFPTTFEEILKFDRGKSQAIEREEYNLAGFFHNQINKITDFSLGYEKLEIEKIKN